MCICVKKGYIYMHIHIDTHTHTHTYIYRTPKEPDSFYLGFTHRIIRTIQTKEGWPNDILLIKRPPERIKKKTSTKNKDGNKATFSAK